MRSKRQKLLNTFVSAGSEKNHHCLRDRFVETVKNHGIIFLFFLIFFSASFAGGVCESLAAIYYVKNGGNDKLAGTSDATAWATIAKVQSTVRSGDTVYFRSQDTWTGANPLITAKAGVTYDGSTYGTGGRAKLQITSYTDKYHGVIDIGWSNVSIRGLEVDCGGKYDMDGITIGGYADNDNDISYVLIDDCVIHNMQQLAPSWSNGISLSPRATIVNGVRTPHTLSHITILNTTLYNTRNASISIYPVWGQCVNDECNGNKNDTILVRGCNIYNDSDVGINIKSDSDNVTIEYCNIYGHGVGRADATGAGIYVETSTYDPHTVPDNLVIRYNLIHDNGVRGFGFKNKEPLSMTMDFYGNILWNNGRKPSGGTANFTIGADDLGASVLNIYNNTFFINNDVVDSTYPRNIVLGTGSINSYGVRGTPTINFKNNIVYQTSCSSYLNTMIIDVNKKLNHSNNLIYCRADSGYHVCSGSNEFYNTASQLLLWEPTGQNTDPIFTGGILPTGFVETTAGGMIPNTNYFTVTSGNAVYNGATLGSPYDGCINWTGSEAVACRQAGAYDIGAYQTSTVVAPAPRISLGRVSKQ